MAGKSAAKYVVAIPFDEVDPATKKNTRYEVGAPYTGPNSERYLAWKPEPLIVPAPAGSSQPGTESEGK